MDPHELVLRKQELVAFLKVYDKTRAKAQYVDGLFQHNDFNTVRRLLTAVYGRLPAGWANLQVAPTKESNHNSVEKGTPFMSDATTTEQGRPDVSMAPSGIVVRDHVLLEAVEALQDEVAAYQGPDPTHKNLGAFSLLIGVLMLTGILVAGLHPSWILLGISSAPYGSAMVLGASTVSYFYLLRNDFTDLLLGSAPDLIQALPLQMVPDCLADSGLTNVDPSKGITVICGFMWSIQINILLAAVAAAVACISSALPMRFFAGTYTWGGKNLANAAFRTGATLAGMLITAVLFYWGSFLRAISQGTSLLCQGQTKAICHADDAGPAYWIAVTVIPLGVLHTTVSYHRLMLYKSMARTGTMSGIPKCQKYLKRVMVGLAVPMTICLIAGIVLVTIDMQMIQTLKTTLDPCSPFISPGLVSTAKATEGGDISLNGAIVKLTKQQNATNGLYPTLFPVGDVDGDGQRDFIAMLENPADPIATMSPVALVFGNGTDEPIVTSMDFTGLPGKDSPWVKMEVSLDPKYRLVNAKALGDVTNDGIDDFLLVFAVIPANPLLDMRKYYEQRAFVIQGRPRSDWGALAQVFKDGFERPIFAELISSNWIDVPSLDFTSSSIFSRDYNRPFFDRMEIGADLDGDGFNDFCTSAIYRESFSTLSTSAFCVYGGPTYPYQLLLNLYDIPILVFNLSMLPSNSSRGFGLILPDACPDAVWAPYCRYDFAISKSMIGSESRGDFIVYNPGEEDTGSFIWFTDGLQRNAIGAELNVVHNHLVRMPVALNIRVTSIVPLGVMPDGEPGIAVLYAYSESGPWRYKCIRVDPSLPTVTQEFQSYPGAEIVLPDDMYDAPYLAGGNVTKATSFDYDHDGITDLLIYDRTRLHVIYGAEKFMRQGKSTVVGSLPGSTLGSILGSSEDLQPSTTSEVRTLYWPEAIHLPNASLLQDGAVFEEGAVSPCTGQGGICLISGVTVSVDFDLPGQYSYFPDPTILMTSLGRADPAYCAAFLSRVPSIIYGMSDGTRAAFGLFGFFGFFLLMFAGWFLALHRLMITYSTECENTEISGSKSGGEQAAVIELTNPNQIVASENPDLLV